MSNCDKAVRAARIVAPGWHTPEGVPSRTGGEAYVEWVERLLGCGWTDMPDPVWLEERYEIFRAA